MTKNITAVLFALLLSTAAFAQYWGMHPAITPGYEHSALHQDTARDARLEEANKIAQAFNGYYQSSVPSDAATRADMKYESYDHIVCAAPYAPGGFGPSVRAWQSRKISIPAVLLPAPASTQYQVAFPAELFHRTSKESDAAQHNVISLTFYTKLFQGETDSITILSNPKIRFVESGCPAGMTLRRAQNARETDICTVYMNYNANRPRLTQAMKNYFANNKVTLSAAAKALKK